MLLADHFTGAYVVDGRAHLRDSEPPTAVSIVSLGGGSTADLVDMCLTVQPMPCALVLDDGRVWVLTAGGSGMIAHAGDSVNDDQRDAVAALEVALVEMGAVGLALDFDDDPKPKRRRKVEAVEPEPEVEDEPEIEDEPEPEIEDAPF
jgi:hypothetical protein